MITLIVGKLGVGKTAEATLRIWKQLTKGQDCYANWEIDFTKYYEYRTTGLKGFLWKWWIIIFRRTRPENFGKLYYFPNLEEMYKIRNGAVFYDEAHMTIYARDFKALPKEFRTKLTQSRKYGLDLYFITQHSTQIDKNVRILANSMIKMSRLLHFLVFWKEWDGEHIDVLANPEMVAISKPPAIGWGVHFMRKGILNSYDTKKIFDPFAEFSDKPMWQAGDFHKLSPEVDKNLKEDSVELNHGKTQQFTKVEIDRKLAALSLRTR